MSGLGKARYSIIPFMMILMFSSSIVFAGVDPDRPTPGHAREYRLAAPAISGLAGHG